MLFENYEYTFARLERKRQIFSRDFRRYGALNYFVAIGFIKVESYVRLILSRIIDDVERGAAVVIETTDETIVA